MRIRTELTIEDHKDFLRMRGTSVAKRVGFLSSNLLNLGVMVLMLGPIIFFGHTLVVAWRNDQFDKLLGEPVALAAMGLGFLLLPVAFVWIYHAVRGFIRAPALAKADAIDEDALRRGLDLGPVVFEVLPDSLRVTMPLEDERFHWSAFEDLKESDHNLFLMLDGRKGVILPKRAFSDNQDVWEFKSMVQQKIGVAA